MNKVFYVDVETTGLDPSFHDILQLAFIIEIDGQIKAKHKFEIQPFNYERIDSKALTINKLTLAKIKKFEIPQKAYKRLIKTLDVFVDKYNKKDKFHPAGYNVRFDIDCLKEFFLKNGDKYYGSYFDYHLLDPITMLGLLEYKGLIKLESYKLKDVCNYFGIKIKAHDAMEDIEATRELIQKMLSYLKESE